MSAAAIDCALARSVYDPHLMLHRMDADELTQDLARPAIRAAKDGSGIVLAQMRKPYRAGANVHAVTMLGYDIEAIAGIQRPAPADLHLRCTSLGWRHWIATTFTHAPEAPRYRLILALTEPLAPDLYRKVWSLPLEQLGLLDCADAVCRDPARLFLLPACRRERAHLFELYHGEGAALDSRTLAALWAAREAMKPKLAPPPTRTYTGPSVIEQFNATHTVLDLLETHGYEKCGQRWARPNTKHGAGLIVFSDGRAFSHHAGDPLAGGPHDAFSIYAHRDHGGDLKGAVRALRGGA